VCQCLRRHRCLSRPRAIPFRKAAPMPAQKVGSLMQAPMASIQSWALAAPIASRCSGVSSSRNCCRSSVELRVMVSLVWLMCLVYRVRGHQRPSQESVAQPSRSIRRRSICSSSKRSSKSMSKISPGMS